MRFLRERSPARLAITDGEYYQLPYFREMIESGAAASALVKAEIRQRPARGFVPLKGPVKHSCHQGQSSQLFT
ncbi:MAG: hypothetical protein WB586_01095 [Chthoniobacterales bacterium]